MMSRLLGIHARPDGRRAARHQAQPRPDTSGPSPNAACATASFASAILRASRRRRGCTPSPTPTSDSDSEPPARPSGSKPPGTWPASTSRISRRCGAALERGRVLPASSPTAAPSTARASWHSCAPIDVLSVPASLRRAERRLSVRSHGRVGRAGRPAKARRVYRGRGKNRRRIARRPGRPLGVGRRSVPTVGRSTVAPDTWRTSVPGRAGALRHRPVRRPDDGRVPRGRTTVRRPAGGRRRTFLKFTRRSETTKITKITRITRITKETCPREFPLCPLCALWLAFEIADSFMALQGPTL